MLLHSRTASLLLFTGLIFQVSPARPCSLAPRADQAKIGGIVGPNPLLFSITTRASLSGPLGETIPLVGIETPSAFRAVHHPSGGSLFFFRPTAPLAEGEYELDGSRFTVSRAALDEIPELGSRGKLELYLAPEDPDGMCGDTSMLLLDLLDMPPAEAEDAVFLVEFTRNSGEQFGRLVSVTEQFEANARLRFFHTLSETGHLRTEKLCVKVSGVSRTGTVGAALDLGCVDPTDEADPRVFHRESSGCSTSESGAGLSSVWVLLGLLWVGRRQKSASCLGGTREKTRRPSALSSAESSSTKPPVR